MNKGIDYWKNKLTTGIDTTYLQLSSLQRFLEGLGYNMTLDHETCTFHIVSQSKGNGDNPRFMSFSTAVALHNGCLMKTNGTSYEVRGFTFTRKDFDKAFGSKILATVHLQRDRKAHNGVKVLTNWVRFHKPYDLQEEMERTY